MTTSAELRSFRPEPVGDGNSGDDRTAKQAMQLLADKAKPINQESVNNSITGSDYLSIEPVDYKKPTQKELLDEYQQACKDKDWKGAELVLKQLLEMAKREDGPVSESVELVLRELFKVCAFDGRFDDAKKYCKQAIDVATQVYGKDDIRVGQDYASLGVIDAVMGNYEESAKSYDVALRIYKVNDAMNNRKVAEQMAEIICDYNNQVLLKLGNKTRSSELYGELIRLAARWRGIVDLDHGRMGIVWLPEK